MKQLIKDHPLISLYIVAALTMDFGIADSFKGFIGLFGFLTLIMAAGIGFAKWVSAEEED